MTDAHDAAPPPTQDPTRLEAQILAYEQHDRLNTPPMDAVLFTGSSSFTRWKNLADDFPELVALNRGFGGSNFDDLLHYMDRIVLPYRPRAIVVYEGTNDIAIGHAPQRVAAAFARFCQRVHEEQPTTPIHFLSGMIQPLRLALAAQVNAANALIRSHTQAHPHLHYIDAQCAFQTPAGACDDSVFEDGIHPNRAGYERWIPILRTALAAYARN